MQHSLDSPIKQRGRAHWVLLINGVRDIVWRRFDLIGDDPPGPWWLSRRAVSTELAAGDRNQRQSRV